MPTTYAHYRMGQEVRQSLKEEEKTVIEEYPELFLIGLHGPDIFFYYKPLSANKIRQIGNDMHERAGKDFFEPAANVVRHNSGNHAYLSYVYGFICHFALDVTCHGYVDEKIAASGISHTEIEAELDRMLMGKDGYDPVSYRPTGHIVPSPENAQIIQAFFEGVDSTQVLGTLKGMVTYLNLLVAPSKAKRFLINTVLRLSGNYQNLHGLVINYKANSDCDDSTKELFRRYGEAKSLAVSLINEYKEYLDGRKDLNQIYNYTFGSKLVEEKEIRDAI
ncbi:MAG: zinc dependent phospholipase C family protein [Suilimivivens sp.]